MALFDYTDVFANSPMTGIADTFTFFKDAPNSKVVNSLRRTFKNCKNLQHLPDEDKPQQDNEGLTTNWDWFYRQCANVENMEETFTSSSGNGGFWMDTKTKAIVTSTNDMYTMSLEAYTDDIDNRKIDDRTAWFSANGSLHKSEIRLTFTRIGF